MALAICYAHAVRRIWTGNGKNTRGKRMEGDRRSRGRGRRAVRVILAGRMAS
uniref:Uncharacterized protein n=1 Tax=Arundo donax TaxID=35708 RepID=A0A0A9BNR2_ARUDO